MAMSLSLWFGADTACSPPERNDSLPNETVDSMKNDDSVALELHLAWSEKLQLRASVRNVSPDTVIFLVHSMLMPSKLILRGSLGLAVKSEDTRSRIRIDTRVPREAFVFLAPGEEHTLVVGVFSGTAKKGYRLTWDAFAFEAVKPGTYSAKAEWESTNDQYYDKDSGKFVTLPGVWKGKVASEAIEIKLPKG
jgi:hypothetical protein